MTDLITRLSKLVAPDREVDARIWCEVHGVAYVDHYALMHETQVIFKEKGKRKEQVSGDDMPHAALYTASVDAAIALAERVLPGWKWRVGRTELFPNGWAYVHKYDPSNCDRADEAACADGKAANPAIALLIALLRAKEASK
ncbi:hypothetical protein R5W60_16585 [Brucella pseudintermedia]|uniref:hypothetical protein n=1 Tax=Brucella pseudintermedia TaxID=370111 RepID=UPI00366ACCAD|nr:hypothetical protein R5W60_16585 [Brucella pseudintermedia]